MKNMQLTDNAQEKLNELQGTNVPDWVKQVKAPLTTEVYLHEYEETGVQVKIVYIGNTGLYVWQPQVAKEPGVLRMGFKPNATYGDENATSSLNVSLFCMGFSELMNQLRNNNLPLPTSNVQFITGSTHEKMIKLRSKLFSEFGPNFFRYKEEETKIYQKAYFQYEVSIKEILTLGEDLLKKSKLQKISRRLEGDSDITAMNPLLLKKTTESGDIYDFSEI